MNSGRPSAVMNFSGNYFEIVLPGVDLETELNISVTVTFQKKIVCRKLTTVLSTSELRNLSPISKKNV